MNSALCVDIGTTSLKAGIIGEDGSVFETVRIPFSKIVCASEKVSEKWFLSLCEACKIFSSVHL
ncbi:MAG: hypothetical protein IKI31_00470, partial [Treponema sp.]|nr:hypothetical protein [Treponema sp.]